MVFFNFSYPSIFKINFDLIDKQIQNAGYTTKEISIDRFEGKLDKKTTVLNLTTKHNHWTKWNLCLRKLWYV